MTLDKLEDILFDGSDAEIRALVDAFQIPSSYEYQQEADTFIVKLGENISVLYGIGSIPRCVKLFGSSYVFT